MIQFFSIVTNDLDINKLNSDEVKQNQLTQLTQVKRQKKVVAQYAVSLNASKTKFQLLVFSLIAIVATFLFTTTQAQAKSASHRFSAKHQVTNKPAHTKSKLTHATKFSRTSKHAKAQRTTRGMSRMNRANHAVAVFERPTKGDLAGLNFTADPLELASNVAFVVDQSTSQVLFEKNSQVALPIASITKLMTSLVVVEAKQDLDELITITSGDLDKEKGTHSRLFLGAKLTRADLLHIALMSSENRAASALGRSYPGGTPAFVAAMNAKAQSLGMYDTYYVDSSGLSSRNVASARDLVKLINAAYQHQIIREYSTDSKYIVSAGGRPMEYGTTNKLVSNSDWTIGLQKTGYIAEAGRCLVMHAMIEGRAIVMVFLDSKGKYSRLADAGRIRKWIETLRPQPHT